MPRTNPPLRQRPEWNDLNELAVFTRVVQAGSFTVAARQLGMPKSTVSRKVAELEERIGVRLMQRTTRKLGLTDAGRIYFDYGERIVAESEEALLAVTRLQSEPRGRLRVSAPLSFGMLGAIVTEYLAKFPEVQVDLVCTDRNVDLVDEAFDVAIRAGRLDDSTLGLRPLGHSRRVLAASPGYAASRPLPRSPSELGGAHTVAFGVGAAPTVWSLRQDDRRVDVQIRPRLTVNDLDVLKGAVEGGVGVALFPEFAIEDALRDGRLIRVLPDWRGIDVPLQAVYPTSRYLSAKVVAFVDLLVERFAHLRCGATT